MVLGELRIAAVAEQVQVKRLVGLLMRDGAINVTFRPQLSADQYERLMKAAELCDTRAEMRTAAQRLQIEWRAEAEIEE